MRNGRTIECKWFLVWRMFYEQWEKGFEFRLKSLFSFIFSYKLNRNLSITTSCLYNPPPIAIPDTITRSHGKICATAELLNYVQIAWPSSDCFADTTLQLSNRENLYEWGIRHKGSFFYSKQPTFTQNPTIFTHFWWFLLEFLYFWCFVAYNTRIQSILYATLLKYQPYLMQ